MSLPSSLIYSLTAPVSFAVSKDVTLSSAPTRTELAPTVVQLKLH